MALRVLKGSPVAVGEPEDRDVIWVSQWEALEGLCDSQSAGVLGARWMSRGEALGASEVQRGGGMAVDT